MALGGVGNIVLTYRRDWATLGIMAWTTPRLDPDDRSRRRLQLLAELAGARAARQREKPQRSRSAQLRQLIAIRRRVVG
ncbi:hypothetical protein ABT336_09960 [Micromonospora sp. NPDC000207]|uniref:hypothetical protein n=1 Tax=Micromonospora sp. NPDC000207 TaxID=3154246 RepID=UPI00331FD336